MAGDDTNEDVGSETENRSNDVTAAMNTANHVYVRSDDFSWVPARVVETNESTCIVSIPQYRDEQAIQSDGGRNARKFEKETINLAETGALLLQNVDEDGNLKEVEDMVDLPFLHEVGCSHKEVFFFAYRRTPGGNSVQSQSKTHTWKALYEDWGHCHRLQPLQVVS